MRDCVYGESELDWLECLDRFELVLALFASHRSSGVSLLFSLGGDCLGDLSSHCQYIFEQRHGSPSMGGQDEMRNFAEPLLQTVLVMT